MTAPGVPIGLMASRWQESGLRWLWLSVLVVILDQATKSWAGSALELYERVRLTPFLNLTLVHNPGAAFSFLSEAAGWQRWFFIALALAVGAGIVVWMRRIDYRDRLTAIGLALILAGALGNVIDRLQHGYVIDFIDFHHGRWHWPAFNAADSAITIGAALMILEALVGARRPKV
jgi:signal peptidase II